MRYTPERIAELRQSAEDTNYDGGCNRAEWLAVLSRLAWLEDVAEKSQWVRKASARIALQSAIRIEVTDWAMDALTDALAKEPRP